MAKFLVTKEANYVIGHLRSGHLEGYIEADSKEDALYKLENEGYDDDLELEIDDYEIEDADFYGNGFEITEVTDD